jgi:hypothetical protein
MERRLPLVLFCLSFLVYNLNLHPLPASDTTPASLLPFSIVLDHSLRLDRFYPWYVENRPDWLRTFHVHEGHVYSGPPEAVGILLAPVYFPLIVLLSAAGWPVDVIIGSALGLERLAASAIASVSVVLFFALARRLTSVRWAFVLALLFAFGSETWSISSQNLWPHGPGVLLILAGLLLLDGGVRDGHPIRGALLAGLCAGLALAIRPTNAIFCLVGGSYLLLARQSWRALLCYGVCPAVLGLGVALHNLHRFGDVLGFYGAHRSAMTGNVISGCLGVLFCPGRGLFVYLPYLAFILLSLYVWLKSRPWAWSPLYVACLAFIVLQVIAIGRMTWWWGGYCWGPRYLIEITPCLLLLLIPALPLIGRSLSAKLVFGTAACWAVFAQGVGAFCAPKGMWDSEPVSSSERPERLWDWKDNPIFREASAGLRTPWVEPLRRSPLAVEHVLRGWQGSFSDAEKAGTLGWRWCGPEGDLLLTNTSDREQDVVLEMVCASSRPEPALLRLQSPLLAESLTIDRHGQFFSKRLRLPSGRQTIHFSCDAPPLVSPSDTRPLVFQLRHFRVIEVGD